MVRFATLKVFKLSLIIRVSCINTTEISSSPRLSDMSLGIYFLVGVYIHFQKRVV